MNLLTIFILLGITAAIIAFRNPIHKAAFALVWAYAHHWDKWIRKVEQEHDMMLKRNVLTRRQ